MRRRALITGGSSDIGLACAQALSAQCAEIILVGRNGATLATAAESLRTSSRATITIESCDVSSQTAVDGLFSRIPSVDILVNNAGVSSSAPVGDTTVDDIGTAFRINALGSFLMSRAALPAMRSNDWGRIITIASISSLTGLPYTSAYTASKHATLGFVRALSSELRGSNITSNAVCPGYVRTEMTERTVARISEKSGKTIAEAEAALTRGSALGRLLEPEEVAHTVTFLAADMASGINGTSIVLDGGDLQH